jgi:hypothetical protein
MPTDADRDVAVDSNEGEPTVDTNQHFTFDTSGLDEKIASGVSRAMGDVFQRFAPQQTAVDPELVEQQLSEDDDAEVRTQKRIHNSNIPLKKRMAEFESFGLGKLADLTRDTASRSMPYYNQYKTEIESELAKLAPAYRADMTTVRVVHDTVVARHIDEIADKRADEKARQLLQSGDPPGGKGRNGQGGADEGPSTPKPSDFFDDEQCRMIEERGGPDAFARKVSSNRFHNWEEYAASREKMANMPRKEGRIVIPLARWQKPVKAA